MTVTAKLLAFALWAMLYMGSAPVRSQSTPVSPSGGTGAQACSGNGTGAVSPCSASSTTTSCVTEVAVGAGNPINVMSVYQSIPIFLPVHKDLVLAAWR